MKIILRIIADLSIFVAIFIVPWWLAIFLVAVGIFIFDTYYEAFVFALLLDSFHGVTGQSFYGYNTFFILTVGGIFIISIFLKNRLKFY